MGTNNIVETAIATPETGIKQPINIPIPLPDQPIKIEISIYVKKAPAELFNPTIK